MGYSLPLPFPYNCQAFQPYYNQWEQQWVSPFPYFMWFFEDSIILYLLFHLFVKFSNFIFFEKFWSNTAATTFSYSFGLQEKIQSYFTFSIKVKCFLFPRIFKKSRTSVFLFFWIINFFFISCFFEVHKNIFPQKQFENDRFVQTQSFLKLDKSKMWCIDDKQIRKLFKW